MNAVLKKTFIIILIISSTYIYSQEEVDSIPLSERYIVFEGDTLLIELEEVKLLKKLKFKTTYDRRYYYWYQKKTLKAYPYAKMAADRLEVINKRLDSIKSKSKKRRYTKRVQKYIEGEFTDQLKKLTRTEGRILIKLIHRQTGETAFDLVKNLRSGWKAFWYNTTAKMFKLSLKDTYDPVNNYKDFLVEDILQRAFLSGTLEEQPSKLDFNYLELSTKHVHAPIDPVSKKQ
ncbi:DUF4294 domain-containing protein [Lutibacter sp. TH_r2]|uniref:DUF4294 domain-containing protein n=1 Tax=Lutibacter sp. TH_r2 TaxID=3082083 RepID=UPI002953A4AB|nr:DUF4294 domain-containing protein [Lutibacter sp. TH_r2]MDV7188445.1 DUF4294 domain-containing protein [Lutibacter sp. TH_r2]